MIKYKKGMSFTRKHFSHFLDAGSTWNSLFLLLSRPTPKITIFTCFLTCWYQLHKWMKRQGFEHFPFLTWYHCWYFRPGTHSKHCHISLRAGEQQPKFGPQFLEEADFCLVNLSQKGTSSCANCSVKVTCFVVQEETQMSFRKMQWD